MAKFAAPPFTTKRKNRLKYQCTGLTHSTYQMELLPSAQPVPVGETVSPVTGGHLPRPSLAGLAQSCDVGWAVVLTNPVRFPVNHLHSALQCASKLVDRRKQSVSGQAGEVPRPKLTLICQRNFGN